mgnify:CR=1 FL=1
MKNEEVLEKVERELKLRGFSPHTIKAYLQYIQDLFDFTGKLHSKILFEDIKNFLENLSIEKNYSGSSVTLVKSAIRFYYEKLLKKYPVSEIEVAPREEKLPVVLTREEIKRIMNAATKLRDKLIIQTMYSCGLRVSEATSLKVEDLDFSDMTGTIRRGKGKKDRRIFLSRTLVKTIPSYLKTKKIPSVFLFSKSNGMPYTTRSFQLIIKGVAERAGITKKVHSHMFRHAFGTHLVEDGCDIVRVQGMMGHSSLETTRLYVTLSKEQFKGIKNPLDSLLEEQGMSEDEKE